MLPAIEARDIAKRYRLGHNGGASTMAELLGATAASMLPGKRGKSAGNGAEDFWALKGVSFEIAPGEVVGLVGENGAGKSTLLKILSRITPPTRGSVNYRGRIGSLLEVGTGFHPELSGRDNVYLSGAILGMHRADVKRHFDEIIDFSGVEAFLDTPVKRYSSGMYMRLAFAVAAHLDTDILLVDEVLAVGDYKFQQKCLNRMDSIAHDGRTVIFISHSLIAIQAICRRAIWLDRGTIAADGPTASVIARYAGTEHTAGGIARDWPDADKAPGNASIRLRNARVEAVGAEPGAPIDVRQSFAMSFEYDNLREGAHLNAGLVVTNEDGVVIFDAGPNEEPVATAAGRRRERCVVPGDLMNDGTYRVSVELRDRGEVLLSIPDLLTFEILDNPYGRFGWYGKWEGAVRPRLDWTSEKLT
ncbi:ABC transporter-like protein [Devosia sp. LC5]|uniref:ABC transporter ATP-binding protein n=1 Tax=Devosia sp. LC5 TaxID=1502724 RepID=UPI0004E2D613|nr:ABC transporter ATP-binding protein [Devosia sp. LC5]KFC67378.1 ABC transporter-like protein [Devosia sp. LC5]